MPSRNSKIAHSVIERTLLCPKVVRSHHLVVSFDRFTISSEPYLQISEKIIGQENRSRKKNVPVGSRSGT